MSRFSPKVRKTALSRCEGRCERCGRALAAGDYHYDHRNPVALSRDSSVSNCQVLCRACHGDKTAKRDVPAIAKAVRIADKMKRLRDAVRPIAAGRASAIRKTLGGAVVPRVSQAEAHREFIARRYRRWDDEA